LHYPSPLSPLGRICCLCILICFFSSLICRSWMTRGVSLQDASNTIQELLDKVRLLEKRWNLISKDHAWEHFVSISSTSYLVRIVIFLFSVWFSSWP
jgi:hypothetical protein